MNVVERFLKYVSYDTMSDEKAKDTPSTAKQLLLAKELVKEMNDLGIDDAHVDPYGIVYGWIPANTQKHIPSVGLIAHMDTSPDMSGEHVKPRIIKNYDGTVILLNEEYQISMSPEHFPSLKQHIGKDLIVTDGTTLLGADDKAGIAEIMSAAQLLLESGVEHGKICIAFTPDEEVGRGTEHFDIEKFGADIAYTVDGGKIDCIAYENFNAAAAHIEINGSSIHPGDAKNKMVNALLLAMEFHQLLPQFEDPACTEKYDGFHHLHNMSGACEKAEMEYIIRNHDETIFARQKQDFINATEFMNKKYGAGSVICELSDTYQNMRNIIEKDMSIIEYVQTAMKELGMTPKTEAIRGGTDGAMLTYKGLPCPNLGTGGYGCHGKYEYACIDEMETCVQLLLKIMECVMR